MRIAHRLDGPEDAPVLVLANSLGTGMALWDDLVPRLGGLRVLRYDQRGHGGSDVPPGPYSIDELVADLVTLLDELSLDHVSLCGISLGGAVAMTLAADQPERLDAVVLACTLPYFPNEASWAERAALVRAEGTEAIADAVLVRWLTPAAPAELADRFRAELTATPREGYAGCCEALATFDFRSRLADVHVPTLVIGGADDPTVPPEQASELAGAVAGADLVVLGGAAHLAHLEQPDAFAAALLAHLEVAA